MTNKDFVIANDRDPVDLNHPRPGQVLRTLNNATKDEEWFLYSAGRKWLRITRSAVELPVDDEPEGGQYV